MFFDAIKTADNTEFKHEASGMVFKYSRSSAEDFLSLKLFEKTAAEEVGFAFVEYRKGRLLDNWSYLEYDNPKYPEGTYGLRSMEVSRPFRNKSLGVLLLFIAAGEVHINTGTHLYLVNPLTKALGFYIQFGFHPEPRAVEGRREHRLSHLRPGYHPDADYIFAEKIAMTRNYLVWRGDINISLSLLTKKVTSRFSFSNPYAESEI
ncbi:hypothetical protein [Endozoicomonas lisbonensis]|uniref:GNAT superfamily N-acetyltransferase n=1 Tax=Endozoicomonas lisbonensis TaxID=3120522 RepID=A0ABV2SJC1_9GAMM